MKATSICFSLLMPFVCVLAQTERVDAALTSAQRKELSEIRRDVSKANSLIRRKKLDEAEKIIGKAETRVDKIAKDAKLKPNDRLLAGIKKFIALQRKALAIKKNASAGKGKKGDANQVSFSKHVAPIFKSKCLSCHNNRASGRLRLDTFAGFEKGGANAPLLVVGNPTGSLLMRRLTAPTNRMPRNAAALSAAELQTIATWISQGARYDGDDKNVQLAELGKAATPDKSKTKTAAVPVTIAKATGNEKVSFTRDIAPTLVNLCSRCHGGNTPRGGLSMVDFQSLMKGGDSGRVLIAGNLEGSRLFRLVGGLELPRMPQGQARITRKFYNDIQVWINEGIKYDGGDPKITLRKLVPTDDELKMERFAKLTPEEFAEYRENRTDDQWKQVLRQERARFVRSKEFYIYGNASAERLEEVVRWAEEDAKALRSMFGVKDDLIWKGRLAIFVYKDRFGYTEFNQEIHNRDTAGEVTGHSVVDPSFEDAFVVLQDVGDEVDADSPGMRVNVTDHLTSAFLKRSGATIPEWITRGTGMAMAAKNAGADNLYVQSLREVASEATADLEKPEDVFANGKFSPTQIGPVGYALVTFMIKAGGAQKYGNFIKSLQSGNNVAAAVKAVYPPADLKALGTAFFRDLRK